jgi:hypothetical protein
LSGVQAAALSPITTMKSFLHGQGEKQETEVPNPNNAELQRLRGRIAELEARMQKPSRAKAPAKRKTTKKRS